MHGEDTSAPIEAARLDWDGDTPRSIFFDDIYFAGDGRSETAHVFLQGNDLPARFAEARRFVIGETGFGTGLNFLAAWEAWANATKPSNAQLHFISVEQFPLSHADLKRAHAPWERLTPYTAKLQAAYPPLTGGLHFRQLTNDVFLTLCFGEAADMLSRVEASIDAWFLDGFAPSRNPDMWRTDVFNAMASISKPNTTLATFTVAGRVREGLTAAGFNVAKAPGHGNKREMLRGKMGPHLQKDTPTRPRPAWFERPSPYCAPAMEPGARIAILGGGIAGTSLATALSRYGFSPTIFDPMGLASGASGNPAGLVMPRLDLGDTPAARFFKSAYLFALTALSTPGAASSAFNPCGVRLTACDAQDGERHRKLMGSRILPPEMMVLDGEDLVFPQAGIVSPPEFVKAMTGTTDIVRKEIVEIEPDPAGVQLHTDEHEQLAFDALVLANGWNALRLVECRGLPLQGTAGQLNWVAGDIGLTSAIAGGPYLAPFSSPDGKPAIVFGATYDHLPAGATKQAPTPDANETKTAVETTLRKIVDMTPSVGADLSHLIAKGQVHSRTAIRCQTPDRLPVVGALPDWGHFGAAYDDLRFGRQLDYAPAAYVPRVSILTGLGSRGLVTAPLCAEIIAAELAGAPAPVEREILDLLHPGRFFVRSLKRAQPSSV